MFEKQLLNDYWTFSTILVISIGSSLVLPQNRCEIRMVADKILHEVLWPPKNMVGHTENGTDSADPGRNSKYCIILFKKKKQFYLFIKFT